MGLFDIFSNSNNNFSIGDMVKTKYTGKIGEIIDINGTTYTVRFHDEESGTYYDYFTENELTSY